jgi:fibronectin-binding autotransporter adhesin
MKKHDRVGAPLAGLTVAALLLASMVGYVSALSRIFEAQDMVERPESALAFDDRFEVRAEEARAISAQQALARTAPAWLLNALPGYSSSRAREAWYSALDRTGDRIGFEMGGSVNASVSSSYVLFNPAQFSSGSGFVGASTSKTSTTTIAALSTNGSWNVNADGLWSVASNWLSNAIADGIGATGNFTFNLATSGKTVTLDTGRTLGILNIGDSTSAFQSYTISTVNGSILTLDNTSNSANAQINKSVSSANDTISVPISLISSLDITNSSAGTLILSTGGITAGSAGLKTITTSTGNVTMSGVIGDGTGQIALAQNGPGTLTVSGVNTYTGNTTISGGKINIGNNLTPFGNGSGTVFLSGGTLNTTATRTASSLPIVNNVAVTADSAITTTSTAGTVDLNFTGTLTGTAGTLTFRNDAASGTGVFEVRFSGGDYTMSRPIAIANGAAGTTRLSDFNTNGTTHTYDGIISGNGGFRRSVSSGAGGTTIFNANNTYTGATTVNAGTLLVNGDDSAATGAVTVSNSGSTLGGAGTIGGTVTLASGATLRGGTGATATGTLTLTKAVDTSAGIIQLALGAGGNHSTLAETGAATWTFGATQQFNFIDFGATTTTYSGLITGVADPGAALNNWVINNPGWAGSFSWDSANGGEIDLNLTAIPEPSTWIGAALALVAIGYTQRRRFAKRFLL